MLRPISLLVLIFLFNRELTWAQSYYFRHYQVEQGLSHNTVFCSGQDKRGFFWMGTKDGLNRFDGYSFKIFRNDPDDSTSLGDNFIRSLFICNSDTLYVGTRNGLYRYNSVMENFATLYRAKDEIRDIKKDCWGNIWLVEGQTLVKLNAATRNFRVYNIPEYFAATSVCIDQKGNVWVSTATGLLQKYNSTTDSFSSYDLFANNRQESPRWIEKIFATSNQTILVGTSNFGVKAFSLKDYNCTELLTYNHDGTGIFARDFIQTTNSEIWIATESGIFIYHPIDGSFTNLKNEYGNPYSLSDNAVYSLNMDREGGIWAGTYFGGLNYFPKQYVSFEKYFPGYGRHTLSGYAVREICEDRYGNLWIGTEDAGLNKLDRKTGLFTQYRPTGNGNGLSYPNIHGLLARNDELWIGTFEHGLDIMNIRTGKISRHFPGKKYPNELRSNFIVVIYQTRKGEIFIGTRQGLYRFNVTANQFEQINEVPTSFIHSILEDNNGTLWAGTLGNGLYFYNDRTGKEGKFIYQPQNKKGINSNSITTIFQTAAGELWIGTEGGGLSRFNPADSTFTNFTIKEGFPSNTIFRILEDGKQRLWITTSNGLVSFHPKTGKVNIYTTANGLLSNQFNYNSGYRDAMGKMYFGSAKGLVSFNPDSFIKNTIVPPIYITGFYLNDKELVPKTWNSPLREAISLTKEVILNYDQAFFSIDFAALSFTAPEMIEYKYITEGLDKDWTYLKTNRKVYFTNLTPGTYTFRVKAANSSGVWSEHTAQLVIIILPPIWASRLAYVIYALISIAIFIFLIKSYHNRVKEKTRRKIEFLEHEKEKEIYQAKINFFTNVAHEIKTPLTLIKAPMEQIAKKAGENSGFDYDLKIMHRNTDRLIELTNQLLDFRKVEATGFRLNFVLTDITNVLMERYSSFKPLADQKGIQLVISIPSIAVMAYVDTDSFQKILNNILYNALNYCHHKVEIELCQANESDRNFTLEIRNDGIMIPAELKERIFEPFYRLKENKNKAGSGIGLALSRSLVDLHKGSLYLKEMENGMNTFVLSMPLQQTLV